jgi:RNA polymerase sigma-70 factor (ECF subfamily)
MSGPPRSRKEAALAQLYEWGRARYPEVAVDLAAFTAHVEQCGALADETVEPARAADLYLACGALAGQAAAVAALQAECRPIVLRYLKPFASSPAAQAEIAQELWEVLLFRTAAEGDAKLRHYSGKGPLGAFAGIVAQRMALMSLRQGELEARVAIRAAAEQAPLSDDTELTIIKQKYRGAFERAIREAIEVLPDRDRLTLRLYFVDGLGVERLGRIYGVAPSTISRRLAKARAFVAKRTRRLLSQRLGVTGCELDSLWNLVASQLDVSVSVLLRDAG